MSEQMVSDIAKKFRKRVKGELYDRELNQHDLAIAIGVTDASLSLAIATFAINKSSREIREKVRKYLNILDI